MVEQIHQFSESGGLESSPVLNPSGANLAKLSPSLHDDYPPWLAPAKTVDAAIINRREHVPESLTWRLDAVPDCRTSSIR